MGPRGNKTGFRETAPTRFGVPGHLGSETRSLAGGFARRSFAYNAMNPLPRTMLGGLGRSLLKLPQLFALNCSTTNVSA